MPAFTQFLNKEIGRILVPLTVVGSEEQNFTITQIVRRCEIKIRGNICRPELLLLNMQDLRPILGID